jgi:hypothetical protein
LSREANNPPLQKKDDLAVYLLAKRGNKRRWWSIEIGETKEWKAALYTGGKYECGRQ